MTNCNCQNRRSGLNIRFTDGYGCNDSFTICTGTNRSGCGCGCGCGTGTWSTGRCGCGCGCGTGTWSTDRYGCGCGCGTSWTSNRCWNRCRDCDCDNC